MVLEFFHLPGLQWIQSSDTAMLSVILVTVWKSLGYAMIFYLSALEKVPGDLYEACGLDGAKKWQRFRDISIPCISPTTFFLMIITMVNSLQAYDQIQILTQEDRQEVRERCCICIINLGLRNLTWERQLRLRW